MKTHEFQKGNEVVRVREPENDTEAAALIERIVDGLATKGSLNFPRELAIESSHYASDGVYQIGDTEHTDSVRMRVVGKGEDEEEIAEIVPEEEMFE